MPEQNKSSKQYMGAQNVMSSRAGITQLIISTTNLAASTHFFGNFLDYKYIIPSDDLHKHEISSSITLLTPNGFMIQLNTIEIELTNISQDIIVSLKTNDFNEIKKKLDALDIELWGESTDLTNEKRSAFFTAPDGTIFQLSSLKESNTKTNEIIPTTDEIIPTADDLFNTLGHCGVEWILIPTQCFDVMFDFFTKVIMYPNITKGIPQNEIHYSRYALFATPSGVTLELVEINQENPGRFYSPLPSFTVENLSQSLKLLEEWDVEILSEIIGSESWGWFYVRILGGEVFQLQGPR